MQNFLVFLFLFLIVSCAPITESDWPDLPPLVGTWDDVVTFGGSE